MRRVPTATHNCAPDSPAPRCERRTSGEKSFNPALPPHRTLKISVICAAMYASELW